VIDSKQEGNQEYPIEPDRETIREIEFSSPVAWTPLSAVVDLFAVLAQSVTTASSVAPAKGSAVETVLELAADLPSRDYSIRGPEELPFRSSDP